LANLIGLTPIAHAELRCGPQAEATSGVPVCFIAGNSARSLFLCIQGRRAGSLRRVRRSGNDAHYL